MSVPYQIPGLILTAICHIIVVFYLSEHRYSRKIFALYSAGFAIIFVGLMGCGFAVGGMQTLLFYSLITVGTFIYFCIVSRDGLPKSCFLFITYFCLFTVMDNMMKLVVKLLLPEISESAGYHAAIVMRSIILMLILFLYKKYAVAVLRSLEDSGRRWWNLALIALLFYLLQAVVNVLNAMNALPGGYMLLTFAALSFLMLAVYGVVFSNIGYMKKDAEAALVRQNAENLSRQLSALQNAEAANRRLRHDMRHHIEAIAEYAKAGNTDAVISYIKEYSIEISEAALKQYSENQTLNNILSAYADKADGKGIAFLVRCNAPKELNVREIDLISVMGNLLENALHGCRESGKEKQSIAVHIRLQSDRLIIVCDNTCSEELKLSNNLPEGKSIGISSILSVCRRYDGNLDYKIENDVCSACVVLNL